MVAYSDALDPRQDMRKPLASSLALHVSVSVMVMGFAWWEHHGKDNLGDPNAGPGSATIETVDAIPGFRRSATKNPVANDTESQVPNKAKPEVKQVEEEDPDAISLNTRKKTKQKQKPKKQVQQQARLFQPERQYTPNQMTSTTGARTYTPMFTPAKGGGGIGMGSTNPFGSRLGWYADLIRQRVAEKWRSQDLDAKLNNLEVVVNFDIQKSGQVTSIRVFQRSGNYAVDQSAMRAVQEASPLPGLPPEFERNVANVEFRFKLQR
jgi:protein TonB